MSIFIAIILSISYLFLISVWILKGRFFKVKCFSPQIFLSCFYLKLSIAAIFYFIYTYHYPTDIGKNDSKTFYMESCKLYNIAMIAPLDYIRLCHNIKPQSSEVKQEILKFQYWRKFYDSASPNDTRQVLIYFSFLQFLACYSEVIMFILVNILSFLSLFALFKSFLILNIKPIGAFIGCFCIPSVLFWSSGLLKEVWLLFFMGFCFYFLLSYLHSKRKLFLICFFFFAYLLLTVKIYIGLILLPILLIYSIKEKIPSLKLIYLYAIGGIGAVVLFQFLKLYNPEYDFISLLTTKRNDFINMLQTDGHQIILLRPADGSLTQFILEIPNSLYIVLCKPLLWDIKDFGTLSAGLENLAFIILIFFAFYFFKKPKQISINTILMIWTFIIILWIIIGYTTPNMGALNRYKSPTLPFLFVVIFSYIDEYPLKNYKNLLKL